MSSYYSAAQLEAMRLARLKKDLDNSIEQLKAQLREEHENNTQEMRSDHVVIKVTAEDLGVTGYSFSGTKAEYMQDDVRSEIGQRRETDFSSLLQTGKQNINKMERTLNDLISKLGERPLLTAADHEAYIRVLSETERIKENVDIGIEDKIELVRIRVQCFLQGARTLTAAEKERIESDYYRYCAMCKMAGEEATETLPYKVKVELKRLSALLEKKKCDEYIAATMQEIMEEVGCNLKENVVMDHVEGQLFNVSGHPLCDVFVGVDGFGIMFEPVVETRSGSLDKIRRIESSVNSICAKYEKVEELAAKRGIILKRVYLEPAAIESICQQSDLSESRAKKTQRKTQVKKEKYLNTEG